MFNYPVLLFPFSVFVLWFSARTVFDWPRGVRLVAKTARTFVLCRPRPLPFLV